MEKLQTTGLLGTGHDGASPVTHTFYSHRPTGPRGKKKTVRGLGSSALNAQLSVVGWGGEGGTGRSSSRLSSLPLQISHARNATTNIDAQNPRDPPQPIREDDAKVDPPARLLQPIEHPRGRRLLRLSVRVIYLKRHVNVRDGVRDGPKAGCEPVFVETVA